MQSEQLKESLRRLRQELEQSRGEMDGELREILEELDRNVHRLLEAPAEEEPDNGLRAHAESVETRFAADHPRLEPILREIVDALARMGI